jgi:hypothetical protein
LFYSDLDEEGKKIGSKEGSFEQPDVLSEGLDAFSGAVNPLTLDLF